MSALRLLVFVALSGCRLSPDTLTLGYGLHDVRYPDAESYNSRGNSGYLALGWDLRSSERELKWDERFNRLESRLTPPAAPAPVVVTPTIHVESSARTPQEDREPPEEAEAESGDGSKNALILAVLAAIGAWLNKKFAAGSSSAS